MTEEEQPQMNADKRRSDKDRKEAERIRQDYRMRQDQKNP
jgi:hypothetical protein